MKYLPGLLYSSLVFCTVVSCKKSQFVPSFAGDWTPASSLKGVSLSEAVSFTINNFAYVGTGMDAQNARSNNFWKYDPVSNSWSQVASMPSGTERTSAVGFSINGKGYVGTGYDGKNYLNDFYEYDPVSDIWSKKNSFSGSPRNDAVAFSIGNNGYVGTGFDGTNALNDFYQYDPVADSWVDIGYPGNARQAAISWSYDNKGYVVTGIANGVLQSDFWVFNPSYEAAKWLRLKDIVNVSTYVYDDGYVGITRSNGVGFMIGNIAYISTGDNGGNVETTWDYDARVDLWGPCDPFEGPQTTAAVGFSLRDADSTHGFILIPGNPIQSGIQSPNLWKFIPWTPSNPTNNN